MELELETPETSMEEKASNILDVVARLKKCVAEHDVDGLAKLMESVKESSPNALHFANMLLKGALAPAEGSPLALSDAPLTEGAMFSVHFDNLRVSGSLGINLNGDKIRAAFDPDYSRETLSNIKRSKEDKGEEEEEANPELEAARLEAYKKAYIEKRYREYMEKCPTLKSEECFERAQETWDTLFDKGLITIPDWFDVGDSL